MQIIYIDTLLAVNLFIDYVLLYITKMLLHINTSNRRLLIGACAGALLSLCVFLPIYSVLLSAIIKITSSITIVLTAYGKGSFHRISIRTIAFIIISMILSTTIMLINNFVKPTDVIVYKDVIYINISPKILLISTAVVYFGLSLYQRISGKHRINAQTHKITLTFENSHLTFESAIDTGCNLREPFSGLPVIITEESLISDVKPNDNKLRLIPYSTAAGSDMLIGFKPNHLAIDGKELNNGCYIGICKGKLKGEIKSIMGPELLEVI